MKSLIWIFVFIVFLLTPKNGFTLTYDKKKSPVDSTNNEKGWTQEIPMLEVPC